MSEITTTYLNMSIEFHENSEQWFCNDLNYYDKSLRNLKERMDRWWKNQNKFERFSAFVRGSEVLWGFGAASAISKFYPVTVTSIAESSVGSEMEVWISYEDDKGETKRKKIAMSKVYIVSDDNTAIVAEIDTINAERKKLSVAVGQLYEKLTTLQLAG